MVDLQYWPTSSRETAAALRTHPSMPDLSDCEDDPLSAPGHATANSSQDQRILPTFIF